MNEFLQQLESAVRATAIHSPTSYSWFGRPSPALPSNVTRSMAPPVARDFLLYSLQQQLYRDFYCQGMAAPAEPDLPLPARMLGMTPFVERLSAANCGTGCYEEGWKVCAIENGSVVVRKEQLQVWARADDCLLPDGSPIAPGASLLLRFPKELLNMSPGYYMALGNTQLPDHDERVVVRFYWHLAADGAPALLQHITTLFNRENLPFRLKVARDPALFARRDAGVLYVLKRDYQAAARLLTGVYRAVAPGLKQGVPAFTKPLASGLGLAEDVGGGESFGEQRCRILADGLIQAYEQGRSSLQDRMRTVTACFAEEGVSPEAPFLACGSDDQYYFCAPV